MIIFFLITCTDGLSHAYVPIKDLNASTESRIEKDFIIHLI